MTTRDPADPVLTRLRDELRELPREAAGEGFTEAVLERLDRRANAAPSEPRGRASWRLAAAAALAALVLAAVAWNLAPRPANPAYPGPAGRGRIDALAAEHARLTSLQAEHARLAAELEEIRRLAAEPAPVLYLGGDDEVELVLDLAELAREHEAVRPLPADYRPR